MEKAQLLREPTFLTISMKNPINGQNAPRWGMRVVIDFYPESGDEDNRLIAYVQGDNGEIMEFQAETDEADRYAETGEITLDPDKGDFADLMGTRDNVDMCDEEDLSYPKRELLDRLDRIMVFFDHGIVYS